MDGATRLPFSRGAIPPFADWRHSNTPNIGTLDGFWCLVDAVTTGVLPVARRAANCCILPTGVLVALTRAAQTEPGDIRLQASWFICNSM